MLFFSLILSIFPGFYKVTLYENDEYIVKLGNYTSVVFRDNNHFHDFTIRRGYNQKFSGLTVGRNVHHFSASDGSLILRSDIEQYINQWIIPSSLCKYNKYMIIYDYSFKFHFNTSKYLSSCFFFNRFDTKHHIILYTQDRNHKFIARFFTKHSILHGREEFICSNSTACKVSIGEPFFFKLTVPHSSNFNISAELLTLSRDDNSKYCRVENINELDDIKDYNESMWDKVNLKSCSSFTESISIDKDIMLETTTLFLSVLMFLFCSRIIPFWEFFFGYSRDKNSNSHTT